MKLYIFLVLGKYILYYLKILKLQQHLKNLEF